MTDSSTRTRRTVLLVEDSVVSRKLLTFMLTQESCDVVLAVNGLEAVDKFKQQTFDVVIMDIQMPVMDGLQATHLMRQWESEIGRHTPIVAVTSGMDRGSCMNAGMDDYIEKPVCIPVFHEVLDRAFLFEQPRAAAV